MSRLGALAVNEEGFVFDPTTGDAFTCNHAARLIVRGLIEGKTTRAIAEVLADIFDVDAGVAERDVHDFIDHLRVLKLV
ncbi:PqqD family protein [Azospirillaceae bacterium]